MVYTIACLIASVLCYYFQVMWAAWFVLGVAALSLAFHLVVLGITVYYARKIMKEATNND